MKYICMKKISIAVEQAISRIISPSFLDKMTEIFTERKARHIYTAAVYSHISGPEVNLRMMRGNLLDKVGRFSHSQFLLDLHPVLLRFKSNIK